MCILRRSNERNNDITNKNYKLLKIIIYIIKNMLEYSNVYE